MRGAFPGNNFPVDYTPKAYNSCHFQSASRAFHRLESSAKEDAQLLQEVHRFRRETRNSRNCGARQAEGARILRRQARSDGHVVTGSRMIIRLCINQTIKSKLINFENS